MAKTEQFVLGDNGHVQAALSNGLEAFKGPPVL